MPESEYKRLIHSAKERASSGFLALAQRAIHDADKNIAESLGHARSGVDQTALSSVRHFLRQDGNVFLRRIDVLFRGYLDRAMQTMYVDMRRDMRKLSIDELSLIDDEVVNHQIEVGRLTERMREANEESIGRLNVIVARLHGDSEARERENPFRPYLLARSLYEAIRETAGDEVKTKVLFPHLANALILHLPAFYGAIREVFESSGVRGEFLAQRSRAAHNQRYFGAPPPGTPQLGTAQLDSRVMPGLQRVLAALQSAPGAMPAAAPDASDINQTANLHELIRKMLAPSRSFGVKSGSDLSKGALPFQTASLNPLVAQLNALQKADAGKALALEQEPSPPIREQLNLDGATTAERMTIDVVAMLFEFILEDPQIPAQLRQHLGRLQIPILKAAVLQPDLLHEERHSARQLLNRMSTAAVGVDPAAPAGQALAAEIDRIVQKVLAEFDTDIAVFSNGLEEFETFLANHLRQDDQATRRAIDAVEAAERFSVLLTNATSALCDVMLPLNVDKRISDCVIHVWPHVLVHAALHDADNDVPADHADSLYRKYHAVLPELLWSVQEKADPQQRAALMRLLPDLVKRLRAALQLIQLPEDESRRILDQMVDMHTAVLRANAVSRPMASPGLEELRQQFSRVAIHWGRATWTLEEPPQPRAAVIEDVFARRGVTAELNLGVSSVASTAADREFLAQTYLLGTRVELRPAAGEPVQAQLVWSSTHRSLYLFKQQTGALVLFTYAALLEALRDETLIPVEYAPVFERAVESLLFDAANMPAVKA